MPTSGHDTRNAIARLIGLTLMADGELADGELAALDRHDIPTLIGLNRDALLQAVIDLSGELLDESAAHRVAVLDPAHIDALLDAVSNPQQRLLVIRAMVVLSKSDGTISDPEQSLLRRALARWHLTLDDVVA
ncbi:TerB family tellurite resistance protein [Zoogloeaceae bacterium G21618-S1]|nr:TerB family tellurite resistance protein [Zoogloeaceae bacterium G21618-S1]